MEHNLRMNSIDLMLIVDSLDSFENTSKDKTKIKDIRKRIIDRVLLDFRERAKDGSESISGEDEQDNTSDRK